MTSRAVREIMLAYDARNGARRLSGASACGRVVAGAQGSPDRLWSSCGHENRAGVYVFAWMPDKFVS
jgi:hypothetical protein